MNIIESYIKDYLDEDPNNIVIVEGINGSGKTTLLKNFLGEYYYFKHVGSINFDNIKYDPSILKNYRIHDRYRPIQDVITASAKIRKEQLVEPSKKYFNFCSSYVKKFTDENLKDKKPLFVFLIHGRYFNITCENRTRNYLTDERLIGDKKTYQKLIKSLSTKYRVLVSDTNKITLYFGDLNDTDNC